LRIEELKKFRGLNPAVDFLLSKLDDHSHRETALVEMVFHLGTQLQLLQSAKPIKLPEHKGTANQSTVSHQNEPVFFVTPEGPKHEPEPSPVVGHLEPKVLPIESKSERMRKLDKDWEPEADTSKKKRGWRW
jgi:hypothetical protein